jgi:hypothetical protein
MSVIAVAGTRRPPLYKELLESALRHHASIPVRSDLHKHFPRARLPIHVRDEYDGYLVDYGLWLDWERGFKGADIENEEALLPLSILDLDKKTVDAQAVGAISIDLTKMTCGSSNARFSEDARSYQLKGLCPECFEPARPSSTSELSHGV